MGFRTKLKYASGACALLLLVTGCGVSGTWQSSSFKPEIARDEYGLFGRPVLGEKFNKATIWINDNHTYTAEAHYGEEVKRSSGEWEKSGDKITFVEADGGAYTYDYKLKDSGKTLVLMKEIEGTTVKLYMDRKTR